MTQYTLKQAGSLLQSKQISAVELASAYLAAIAEKNPALNGYITIDQDKTLAEARAADERIAQGNASALTGVPVAYKDIFCQTGWRSACASKMLDNFISPYTATVVQNLLDEGMVTLYRTNMDEFAMGSTNENSFYGAVKNPWNPEHVPGGSSGGSAAVVAARLAPAALGSDTGGSIRQPASHCGITGIKPTYGTVSRFGMVAYASSFDQAGPMAQTAEDCAILLNAMAGFDPKDSTSFEREKEDYTRDLDNTIDLLKAQGAEPVEVSLPQTKLSIPAYYVLASAEAGTNLSRYDGVRYGHRAAQFGDLEEMYGKTRAEGFGSEVKRRIMIGTYVLSHGYYDAYYLKAQKLRRLVADDFQTAFARCDLILAPTAPSAAPKIGADTSPVETYLSDIYTIAVNLAGLPALTLPAGFSGGGLPVGVQLVGNYFAEAKILGAAHQIQLNSDWHGKRPE
ncbi:Asp-tRNA(Asn)/Glu-tRNA(Gln) amidotransferase subunit GatA [Neisseria gonorrhoeae]|nr:Asp-tRNA(Asn)/Glu-tRNA(Gln) amidotransferase subunit GatA [Neisseria gonorrhoeae]